MGSAEAGIPEGCHGIHVCGPVSDPEEYLNFAGAYEDAVAESQQRPGKETLGQ